MSGRIRHLLLILGDQLDRHSSLFDSIDTHLDAFWMAEVAEESTHVWSHKARIALFLSAMRHFRAELLQKRYRLLYRQLNEPANTGSLQSELTVTLQQHRPEKVIVVEPGDYRVAKALQDCCRQHHVELHVLPDTHFFCSRSDFVAHARSRSQLRMEFFYRAMRRQHGILMDEDQPISGKWNFDQENRKTFGKNGPPPTASPIAFPPDNLTKEVLQLIESTYPDHPGDLSHFDWPVTPEQAELALQDFLMHRLPFFGDFQDAMWTEQPYLFHSRLSAALNLKLLNPRHVVAEAEKAYRDGKASLPAVEGFIRQILGWREYVRGVYWLYMPDYLEKNALAAHESLPSFYWTGQTDMHCLKQAIDQTLQLGYAHHIQRLMITGLYALLFGVHPQAVHEWYLAVYVDAVEWVELPNTLGMSQYADGGIMASKPYAASGKYIDRMSNYCSSCRYNPAKSIGDDACPFTTLYWDFLLRHEKTLARNPRMVMQVRNLQRLDRSLKDAIRLKANQHREEVNP